MLGCICRIHLGIQWSRIQCSRAYAQHQLGILYGLLPTLLILIFSRASKLHAQHKCFITHVLHSFLPNTNIKYSCSLELFAQYKNQALMWSRASRSTQTSNNHLPQRLYSIKTSHPLCSFGSTPNTWNHIHKRYAFGLHSIYQKNHHYHVQ